MKEYEKKKEKHCGKCDVSATNEQDNAECADDLAIVDECVN